MSKVSLNIGPPNQESLLPNGKKIRVRDELGLSLDPKENADQKCRTCYGRGVFSAVVPSRDGKAMGETVARSCGCVNRVYARKRRVVERIVVSSKDKGDSP